jgi:hypothetical protein
MKQFRVFLNPDGERYIDVTVPPAVDANVIFGTLKLDGAITTPYCIVPRNSVFLVLEINAAGDGGAKITVFPGGKSDPPQNEGA